MLVKRGTGRWKYEAGLMLVLSLSSCGGRATDTATDKVTSTEEPSEATSDHWLLDCAEVCELDLVLDLQATFPNRFQPVISAYGAKSRTYSAYQDGYLYFTLSDPPAIARASELGGDLELLVENEHEIGDPAITDAGVFWYRHISGGVTPEGVSPVEAVLEGYYFDQDRVVTVFETEVSPARPTTDGEFLYAISDNALVRHSFGLGEWEELRALHPTSTALSLDILWGQRLLWTSEEDNLWHLHSSTLNIVSPTDAEDKSIPVGQPSLSRPNSPSYLGQSADFVFLQQQQHLGSDDFPLSLFALNPVSQESVEVAKESDATFRYLQAASVGEDLLVVLEEAGVRSLALLLNWQDGVPHSRSAFLTLVNGVVRFHIGESNLLVLSADGRVLRRALP